MSDTITLTFRIFGDIMKPGDSVVPRAEEPTQALDVPRNIEAWQSAERIAELYSSYVPGRAPFRVIECASCSLAHAREHFGMDRRVCTAYLRRPHTRRKLVILFWLETPQDAPSVDALRERVQGVRNASKSATEARIAGRGAAYAACGRCGMGYDPARYSPNCPHPDISPAAIRSQRAFYGQPDEPTPAAPTFTCPECATAQPEAMRAIDHDAICKTCEDKRSDAADVAYPPSSATALHREVRDFLHWFKYAKDEHSIACMHSAGLDSLREAFKADGGQVSPAAPIVAPRAAQPVSDAEYRHMLTFVGNNYAPAAVQDEIRALLARPAAPIVDKPAGRYEIHRVHKRITRDSFEHGCSIEAEDTRELDFSGFSFRAESLSALLAAIHEQLGLPVDYVFLGDDGGEPVNRFSINRQENDEGNPPTAAECTRFEAGEIDLWLADYDFIVRHVIERGVTADEFRAQCPGVTVEG